MGRRQEREEYLEFKGEEKTSLNKKKCQGWMKAGVERREEANGKNCSLSIRGSCIYWQRSRIKDAFVFTRREADDAANCTGIMMCEWEGEDGEKLRN